MRWTTDFAVLVAMHAMAFGRCMHVHSDCAYGRWAVMIAACHVVVVCTGEVWGRAAMQTRSRFEAETAQSAQKSLYSDIKDIKFMSIYVLYV